MCPIVNGVWKIIQLQICNNSLWRPPRKRSKYQIKKTCTALIVLSCLQVLNQGATFHSIASRHVSTKTSNLLLPSNSPFSRESSVQTESPRCLQVFEAQRSSLNLRRGQASSLHPCTSGGVYGGSQEACVFVCFFVEEAGEEEGWRCWNVVWWSWADWCRRGKSCQGVPRGSDCSRFAPSSPRWLLHHVEVSSLV